MTFKILFLLVSPTKNLALLIILHNFCILIIGSICRTTFQSYKYLIVRESNLIHTHIFHQIVCYYTNWSQYRTKIGKFTPEDIQPDLCTHVIFAFGWLKKGKLSSFESNDETKDGKTGLYDRINALKKANPKLKTLLAIGKTFFLIKI